MARRSALYEADAKNLIRCFIDLEDDDENLQICLQFVLSNFVYHSFLDVNSHILDRTLQGVQDKFYIHSQEEKANVFKSLVSQFLETPDFEHKEEGKTDTHYRILSLLLSLSDKPTSIDYKKPTKTEQQKEEESFDWGAYLREGEEQYAWDLASEGSWSSDDEDSDPDSASHPVKQPHLQPRPPEELVAEETLLAETGEESLTFEWLSQHIVKPYWKRQVQGLVQSHHRSAVLNDVWQDHLSNESPLLQQGPATNITEYHIVREIIWILMGCDRSHILHRHGNSFHVNQEVQLSHATHESLSNVLVDFCHYGDIIQRLQGFIAAVSCGGFHGYPAGWDYCQTYQAFAETLSAYMTRFQRDLTAMEKKVTAQDDTWTLNRIRDEIRDRLAELDILEHIYKEGIIHENVAQGKESMSSSSGQKSSHATKASLLLAVLYQTLLQCDTMGEFAGQTVRLLLPIWLRTSKPYWDIVDQWVFSSTLIDPCEEFIIKRNQNAGCLDETFWDGAFTINGAEVTPEPSSNDTTVTNFYDEGDKYTRRTTLPSFLAPVLEKIVVTGKSMEMLQNLTCADIRRQAGAERKTLYNTFVELLEQYLESDIHVNEDHAVRRVRRKHESSALFRDNIAQQMRVKGVHDPLLTSNFVNLFNYEEFHTGTADMISMYHGDESDKSPSDNAGTGLMPIELSLEKCLYPQIERRHREVCSTLLQTLKDKYHIIETFSAMRRYFLMEAGDIMYDFYTAIFKKLAMHEPWQDVSFLNIVLQDALVARQAPDAEKLYVTIEKPKKKRNPQPITALDGLTLNYQLAWPLDMILNSKCLEIYSQLFTFILQIKWAKHSLEGLRFPELEEFHPEEDDDDDPLTDPISASEDIPRRQLIHRMHLLRMRFMHFVNSLHNFIMTTILHSTCLDFQAKLEAAEDLDEMLRCHNEYLSSIYKRCLLHHKVILIREALAKVLNLVIVCVHKWREGIDKVSVKSLKKDEEQFSKSFTFLSAFFGKLFSRGSFPHLESLSFALITSSEKMCKGSI